MLKPFTKAHGWPMVPACAVPPITFITPHGFSTHRLAHLLDSLVRVSRRADGPASAGTPSAQLPEGAKHRSSSAPLPAVPSIAARCCTARGAGTSQHPVQTAALTSHINPGAGYRAIPSHYTISCTLLLACQRSFHRSLEVLFRYRSPIDI